MKVIFKVAPRATRQIRDAATWWLGHRSKAPSAFAEDLDAAFALIQEFAEAGEPVRHARIPNLRRVLLGRVRYHLYYVFSADEQVIEILALWHTSRGRDPNLTSR